MKEVSNNSTEIQISKWNGDGWSAVTSFTNTLAGDSGINGELDLAVDSNNHLHLVFQFYQGEGVTSLRGIEYGYYNGASWTFTKVDYASDPSGWKNFNYPKVAVDSAGKAHIVYRYTDANNPRKSILKYATNQTGSFQISELLLMSYTSEWEFFAGIKIDSQDRIHLSYRQNEKYYYTSKSLADPDFGAPVEMLDQVYSEYYPTPIVMDANDRIHFTYSDYYGNSFVASYEAGQWKHELVFADPADFSYPIDVVVHGGTKYLLMIGYVGGNYYGDYYYYALAVDGGQSLAGNQVAPSSGYDSMAVFWVDPSGNYIVVLESRDLRSLRSLSGTSAAFGLLLQDTTPPDPPVILSPAGGAYVSEKQPTYSGTAEANSTVEVFVDGSSIGTTAAEGSGNWTLKQPTDLADGSHTVKAKATDAASNTGPESNAIGFTVDTIAPEISEAAVSANNTYVDVTFSEGVYGTDQGGGAIDKDDLVLIFTPGNGGATMVDILDVRKPDAATLETAGMLTGGETTIRVFLNVTGTDNGTGKIEILPADAASIFDRAGNAASELETTGELTLKDTTSPPPAPVSPVIDDGLDVYVNGEKVEKIAHADAVTINGKKVTTVSVDEEKLNQKLDTVDPGYTVLIPVHNDSNTLIAELNARMVGNMAAKDAVLEVQTEQAVYVLPAKELNIDAVLEQFGSAAAPENIEIRVEMTLLDDSEVTDGGNLQRVAPVVDFRITASFGDEEISIHQFTSYVERMIAIPDGVERNRITTGVVILPDGTMHYMPTKVLGNADNQYAVINSLTNSIYTVIYNEKTFEDIRDHWAQDYIENMASRLVLTGKSDQAFDPDADITRAEFIAIVVRALGLHSAVGNHAFRDVKSTDWYASAVQIAVSYNLIQGYPDGTFRLNAPITREEAMAVIARAMALAGMDTSLSAERQEQLLAAYTDGGSVGRWARQSAALNVHYGIFQGYQQALRPQDSISRAETAAIIQRLLQQADLIN